MEFIQVPGMKETYVMGLGELHVYHIWHKTDGRYAMRVDGDMGEYTDFAKMKLAIKMCEFLEGR